MKILVCATLLLSWPAAGLALYPVASRVEVAGELVSLADLVPEAPQAWSEVALGRAPRPGGERVLDREWVLQRARQVGAEEVLQLHGDVVLSRAGMEVGRAEVVRAVEQALDGRLHAGEKYRVESVGLPRPVAYGELELQAHLPDGEIPSPATIWVDVLSDGVRVERAWVRLEIFRGRPAVVLTRNMKRGEVVDPRDVEVRSTDAGRGDLTDPNQVVGKMLARSLREGSLLSARDLESVPAVERGDLVRLVAKAGGVVASTVGTSLESGGVGDLIRVENQASGRRLTGTLREGGVVEICTEYGR